MKVYKYRGIEENIFERDLRTFQNNLIFAPKFEMLNDPFEANFNEIISNTFDFLSNSIAIDSNLIKNQLHNVINYKHKLGILSLSRQCHSEQMWAYYASSNRGYCMEYDLKKLKDKSRNFDFTSQLDISYSNEIPVLELNDIKNNLMFQKMFGVKKQNWSHEEEIRLIFDNSSLKKYHESAITSIYFGYQSSESLIDIFKETFYNRNIKFYRITVNKKENRFESILIHESEKKTNYNINKYSFEILKYHDNDVVENYHIYLKDSLLGQELNEFVLSFREKFCYKPSNLSIYNTSDIIKLVDCYPLKGTEYIKYAEAFIALADFSTEDYIIEYPFKDLYYRDQIKEFS